MDKMKQLGQISIILTLSIVIAMLIIVSAILFSINEDLKNENGRLFFENRDLQQLKGRNQIQLL